MGNDKKQTYSHILNQLLKNYHDPEWLGTHSPLASLYFASDWIEVGNNPLTPLEKGRGLQKMVRAAADTLWPTEPPISATFLEKEAQEAYDRNGRSDLQYQYLLLELRYFRRLFPLSSFPTTTQDFQQFLGVGRTQFFDHIKLAVNNFGDALLQLSQPTFRLEQPTHQTDRIGRGTHLDKLVDSLNRGEAAAVSGISGVGKTALGRLTAQTWGTDNVFWYTVRPTITDHVETLVHALGSSLHIKHQSILWKQLMSDSVGEKKNKTDIYLGLIRQDVQALDQPMLLCFDEVDLLQTDTTADRWQEHRSFLFFLESLCEICPVLLMGQHIPIDVKQHIPLTPIQLEQTQALVAGQTTDLSSDDIEKLHEAGRGIPRLIELALVLYKTGEPIPTILTSLAESASAHAIIERLWNRLNKDEQATLGTLSALQGAIAAELLPQEQRATLPKLIQRTLINTDTTGGIVLDELIRRLIYRRCSRELRDQAHLIAAVMRHTLGEYTLSAYHYAQAEEYTQAITIWFPQKKLEIQRGHTNRARDIFLNISGRHLNKKHQKQLQIIRNQLYLLTGEAKRIIEETPAIIQDQTTETTNIELRAQLGDAYRHIGHSSKSEKQYEQNMIDILFLLNRGVMTANRLNILQISNGQIEQARKQVQRSFAYSHYAQGLLASSTANFQQANGDFENALTIAESLDDQQLLATLERRIAQSASYCKDTNTAIDYYNRAATRFRDMGDIVTANKIEGDIGVAYLIIKNYAQAVEKLENIIDFFHSINDVYTLSAISYSLSESYFYLERIEQARSMALSVMHFEHPSHQPYAFYILGLIENHKKRIDSSIDILNQGIILARRNQDKYIEAYLLRGLATTLGEQTTQAIQHYQESFTLFEQMGLTDEAEETRLMLQHSS